MRVFLRKDVTKISKRYKDGFLLSCIKRYKNKIVNSGKFDLTNNDIDIIVDELTGTFKKNYSKNSQIELIRKFRNDIVLGLENTLSLFNIFNQSSFLERIVEIVLLKIFSPDYSLSISNSLDPITQKIMSVNSLKSFSTILNIISINVY